MPEHSLQMNVTLDFEREVEFKYANDDAEKAVRKAAGLFPLPKVFEDGYRVVSSSYEEALDYDEDTKVWSGTLRGTVELSGAHSEHGETFADAKEIVEEEAAELGGEFYESLLPINLKGWSFDEGSLEVVRPHSLENEAAPSPRP